MRRVPLVSLFMGAGLGTMLTAAMPRPSAKSGSHWYEGATIRVRPYDAARVAIDMDLDLMADPPERLRLRFSGGHVEALRVVDAVLGDVPHVGAHDETSAELVYGEPNGWSRRRLHLTLLDRPTRRYDWGTVTGVIPWINHFGIEPSGGAWLETDVGIPPGLRAYSTGGEGLRCGAPPITSCREFGHGPRQLVVALAPYDDRVARVGFGAIVLAAASAIAWAIRRAYAQVVERLGTEQFAAEAAYREVERLPNVLDRKNARRYAMRVFVGLAFAMASIVAVDRGLAGRSPLPMPWVDAIAVAIVALVTVVMVTSRTARAVRPAFIGLAIGALVTFESNWPALAILPMAVLGVWELIAARERP